MKHILRFLAGGFIILFGSGVMAQKFDYVVRNVTLLRPEQAQPLIAHQDVYIRDEKIVKITDAAKETPKHSMHVIEGSGKYLMAGLADMHVHLPSEKREQFFWLNLAAGVTTVRSMRGKPEHLELRKQILKWEMTGPDLILAAPYFPNKNIKKADLLDTMKAFVKAGYDCVKVLAVPDSAYFEALMLAANTAHIPVVGHWPWQVPIERVIEAGYDCIEHLQGLEESYENDSNSVARLAWLLKKHHTWNCPSLDYYSVMYSQVSREDLRKRAGLDLLDTYDVERWDSVVVARFAKYNTGPSDSVAQKHQRTKAYVDRRYALVKKLSDLGAEFIVSPAEANDPYGVPGFCMWEEMNLLAHCGISNQQILKMATYNAAAYMKQTKKWGSIAVGQKANMIMLNKNPLDSIKNISEQDGVFLRGEYLPADLLRQTCLLAR